MYKSIRVTEDVYSCIKTRATKEGKSLSAVIRDLCSTSGENQADTDRLSAVESELKQILNRLDDLESLETTKTKNKRPSRDLNPSRSLDRAP